MWLGNITMWNQYTDTTGVEFVNDMKTYQTKMIQMQ